MKLKNASKLIAAARRGLLSKDIAVTSGKVTTGRETDAHNCAAARFSLRCNPCAPKVPSHRVDASIYATNVKAAECLNSTHQKENTMILGGKTVNQDVFLQKPSASWSLISHPGQLLGPVSMCRNSLQCNVGEPHGFVDFERVVSYAYNVTRELLPQQTSDAFRIPPFGLIRLRHGGKTATASAIFERIKLTRLVHPIAITFSADRGYSRRSHSDTDELMRLIVDDLTNMPTPAELEQHLGSDENIVLIIDDIHNLNGGSIDEEAAAFLRKIFLDQPRQYLIFTSKVPFTVEPDNRFGRGITTLDMSLAQDLAELRSMGPDFATLTAARARWYGYLPSLVLTAGRNAELLGRQIMQDFGIPEENKLALLMYFVDEVLGGLSDPDACKYFCRFRVQVNSHDLVEVAYPLCHVYAILRLLNLTPATAGVLDILDKVKANLDSADDAVKWQCAVQAAVVFRCMHAQWFGTMGPFNIAPLGVTPQVQLIELPDQCTTVEQAGTIIFKAAAACTDPILFHFTPCNAEFEEVDGFVAYTSGPR